MSVKTNAFMNWTNGTFTYNATVVNIDEIEDVQIQDTGEKKPLRTGADNYPHLTTVRNRDAGVQVIGANVYGLSLIPKGTIGVFSAIFNDAINGTGSGAITVTVNGAQLLNNPFQGKNNEYGKGTVTFATQASDGQTDPIVITQAS